MQSGNKVWSVYVTLQINFFFFAKNEAWKLVPGPFVFTKD